MTHEDQCKIDENVLKLSLQSNFRELKRFNFRLMLLRNAGELLFFPGIKSRLF